MYKKSFLTFYDFIRENAMLCPDNVAFHDEENEFTWKTIEEMVSKIVKYLKTQYNMNQLTSIYFICERKVEDILLLYALFSLGCKVHISNNVDNIEQIKVDYIFYSNKTDTVNSVMPLSVDAVIARALDYGCCSVNVYGAKTSESYIVIYTSGTEEKPKGILIDQYSFLNNMINVAEYMGYLPSDKICLVNPLNHCLGLGVLFMALVKRVAIYVPKTINYDFLLQQIPIYSVTILNAVPTLFLGMKNSFLFTKENVHTIRAGLIVGGKYTKEQFCEIEEAFSMKLFPSYGMSETCAGVTFGNDTKMAKRESCYVGKFMDGISGCIKGSDGVILSANEEGEICIKGYNLMKGYYSSGSLNTNFTDSTGWYHTGDMGYIDIEGNLFVTERIKNIIIRGGENISARKIEEVILKNENIYECVVVGVDDAYYGEVPCAWINLRGGKLDRGEFEMYLIKKLNKNERPKILIVSDFIPKNENGKYNIRLMKYITRKYIK